ncbi:hypothetical protein L916_14598, partial [Phytophthora nicotianae]
KTKIRTSTSLQADPMKCADPDCTCADLTTTDPCI